MNDAVVLFVARGIAACDSALLADGGSSVRGRECREHGVTGHGYCIGVRMPLVDWGSAATPDREEQRRLTLCCTELQALRSTISSFERQSTCLLSGV